MTTPSFQPRSTSHEAYDIWHSVVSETAEHDCPGPWHEAAREYLGVVRGRRVLEIGCGRGSFAREVSSRVPSLLVACDYSPTAVLMARDSAPQLAFVVADIQRLPFRQDAFDVVISLETIEHVPEPKRGVAELGRVLTLGGTLLLTTPNYLGIMGLFRGYKRLTGAPFTEVGQPINKFVMLPRTTKWVRDAGLKVVEARAFHHYLPVPRRPPVRLPMLDRIPIVGQRTGLHSFIRAVK
jgi:ubiquinone/menaquinone biosynthesis C-methylase UbiE